MAFCNVGQNQDKLFPRFENSVVETIFIGKAQSNFWITALDFSPHLLLSTFMLCSKSKTNYNWQAIVSVPWQQQLQLTQLLSKSSQVTKSN